ncbi:NIPSNAP family protein [uncultured Draconibacterium sp.]|uniref:NIPSNAP family protein n=1 Tax=uncultured Draconibacterium sp. TaxID=1573823 RepID=UPI003261CD57
MKCKLILSYSIFVCILCLSFQSLARDYYQVKVYTIKNNSQEARVDHYLKTTFKTAANQAGINEIGVFKPIETDKDFGKKIFVFVPLKSLSQLEKIEQILTNSASQSSNCEYVNAPHDNPPFERIESTLLRAFSHMPEFHKPSFATPKSEQIFELRSYQGATEKLYQKKVEMFNEGGEIALFKKLDFNAVFYAEVLVGAHMPNLMYMTSFENMEANEKHWATFRAHPDWEVLKNKKEYANTVSHIDKWLCHPASYSDF